MELDSNTSFVEGDLCRHTSHSIVTNLPRPIFQEFGVGGNNTFNTFSPFLASNLVQVKPFRFHNKNVKNFASRMFSIAKERHRAITEKMSIAAFPERKADTAYAKRLQSHTRKEVEKCCAV